MMLQSILSNMLKQRVLAVCDEHHHAGRDNPWGDGADNAFSLAKHTLVLTGTPITPMVQSLFG